MTIDNPQRVLIGPWDHGASNDADPFHAVDTPVAPPKEQQFAEMISFFDSFLKEDGEATLESEISYYTLGADRWTTTKVWPPAGFSEENWYFAADGMLTTTPPQGAAGADAYTVNFDATTGRHNRWYTNNGSGDVIYPDHAEEDGKLLTFTSTPFEYDTEITGHPVITLYVRSTHEDGALFAYLEDVAPDGKVTYITEGQLRAVMRRISEMPPPYKKLGPHRSELRNDTMPFVPGVIAETSFELWATSVLIKKGHRLRIAVAGGDKDSFLQYPRNGEVPTITVERNQEYPSHVRLPVQR
jgi:putative CocE/NonD family hydrolase